MTDSARTPAIGLTTWFYAAAADGAIYSVRRKLAAKFLGRNKVGKGESIPHEWSDVNGGLTLVGVGLVLQAATPVYVERFNVSYHVLRHRPNTQAITGSVDYESIAARLSADAHVPRPNVAGLAVFLEANRQRLLLDDLYILMQTGRSRLDDIWMDHLIAGRQGAHLWNLRTSTLHAPLTPINLSRASIVARRKRRGVGSAL